MCIASLSVSLSLSLSVSLSVCVLACARVCVVLSHSLHTYALVGRASPLYAFSYRSGFLRIASAPYPITTVKPAAKHAQSSATQTSGEEARLCLSVCLPVCPPVCLSACLPVWLPACVPVCLCASLSLCLTRCVCLCLSVSHRVSLCLCLSVSLSAAGAGQLGKSDYKR